jgi:hypothetical protein
MGDTPPEITVPALGAQGDLILFHIDLTGAGATTATVTSVIVTGAAGLTFKRLDSVQFVTDVETWYSVIPSTAAGATDVTLTVDASTAWSYCAMTVDEYSSDLGTETAWLPEVAGTLSNPSSDVPPFPPLVAPITLYEMAYIGYMQCVSVSPTLKVVVIHGTSFLFTPTTIADNLIVFGTPLTGGDSYQPIASTSTAAVSAAISVIWLAYVPESGGGTTSVAVVDQHLMDAEQVEVNTLATPGPTSWQPPRDIQINLLPVRQNLVPDPVGRGGGYGWTLVGGTLKPSIDYGATPPSVVWPAETTTGYVLTSSGASAMTMTGVVPANPLTNYSFSAYALSGQYARSVQLILDFINKSNQVTSSAVFDFTEETGSFVRGAVVNTQSPVNTVSARIQILIDSETSGERHYVGAPLLEMSSFAGIYFDANFEPATDYIFEGLPNQSPSDYYPNFIAKLSRLVTVLENYTPLGSTYSVLIGAEAMANAGLLD